MENSSIRRQWLDSYQSHLLEEEHSPQTIRKYIHDIAFFFSFLPAEAEISKEKVLAYKQELIQKYRPASAAIWRAVRSGVRYCEAWTPLRRCLSHIAS